MTFETKEIELVQTSETVYAFFSDFNNFQSILPATITDWQSDADHCSFSFDGKIRMAMMFETKTPPSFLKIIPDGNALFDYSITCNIAPKAAGCVVIISFEAALNPFMAMMAEKPLAKLVATMEEKIRTLFPMQ